ncbi:MAG: aminotransferase DegT [Deltaproteobacteria bacterium]|nr:aminotransferase DegT [Deltaproteobacteria bacterium]
MGDTKQIQLFRPRFRVDECLDEISVCLEKGWTGIGFKTVEFEDAWKRYTGLPYAHFLNSATAGLHLAVKVLKEKLGWNDGDEIITTPLTFVSTNHAILYEKLAPVFADVDLSLNLDPRSVSLRITPRTRAVIFVGMGGNARNLPEVIRLARERGLAVILDAAHMSGTRIDGIHVGFDVDATVFSFQAVKNLPTADSGMVCFNKEEDDFRARRLSWLGINKDTYARTGNGGSYRWAYEVDEVGFKYHGNALTACLALVGLRYLDEDNSRRRELAELYAQFLRGEQGVTFIEHECCESSRHLVQVAVGRREELLNKFYELGIYPGVHYRLNTDYRPYAGAHDCPVAQRLSDQLISLPLHLDLVERDVETISKHLVQFVREA